MAALPTHPVVSVTHRGRLYVDGTLIAEGVLSTAVTGHFLLYTTRTHTLEVRSLHEPVAAPLEVRTVEAGGVIIAPLSGTRVVVQMPRGNLETVAPRALLLSSIHQWLDAGDWLRAWQEIRRQRVDANILYDHNPEVFTAAAPTLVHTLPEDALSALLISARDEDVTATMYASIYRKEQQQPRAKSAATGASPSKNKVNTLCEVLSGAMLSAPDPYKYVSWMGGGSSHMSGTGNSRAGRRRAVGWCCRF